MNNTTRLLRVRPARRASPARRRAPRPGARAGGRPGSAACDVGPPGGRRRGRDRRLGRRRLRPRRAGGSPAYAVDQNSDGDVIVTVHRLDDAAGLEKALLAEGHRRRRQLRRRARPMAPSPSTMPVRTPMQSPSWPASPARTRAVDAAGWWGCHPPDHAGPGSKRRPVRLGDSLGRRPPSLTRAMTGCSRSPPAHRCSRTTGISTSVPASTARSWSPTPATRPDSSCGGLR